jgi:hypothetical protein
MSTENQFGFEVVIENQIKSSIRGDSEVYMLVEGGYPGEGKFLLRGDDGWEFVDRVHHIFKSKDSQGNPQWRNFVGISFYFPLNPSHRSSEEFLGRITNLGGVIK